MPFAHFLIAVHVLGLVVLGAGIAAFARHRRDSRSGRAVPWRPLVLVGSALGVACVLGWYPLGDGHRVVGFPFMAAVFERHGSHWEDFVGPLTLPAYVGDFAFGLVVPHLLRQLFAARRGSPSRQPERGADVTMDEVEDGELGSWLAELHAPELERREEALARVMNVAKRGLSAEQVDSLIVAATAEFPPAKFDFRSYEESLLQATSGHWQEANVSTILAQYEALSARARPAALAALARLGTSRAIDAYLRLFERHGWPEGAYPVVFLPLAQAPSYPDKVLPALAGGRIRGLPPDVRWSLVRAYAANGLVPPELLERLRRDAARDGAEELTRLQPLQAADGTAWRWSDDYLPGRQALRVTLEVLGFLGADPAVTEVLRRAEASRDPYLALFAVVSLVRLGESPDNDALASIASDAETRNSLFDLLAAVGRSELFPASERTQEKFAESEMVQWLAFPTELGGAPARIELMKTVARDLGEPGKVVYYVYRFATDPPHWAADDGWMAGISGPFLQRDFPTTVSWGDTFSRFTPWDQFSPEEHLASVTELLERWYAEHASREE